MSTKFSLNIIKYRENIFLIFYFLLFFSFIVSYALSNILIFLFPVLFFIDSKKRVKEKYRTLIKSKITILYISFFLIQVIGIFYSENLSFAIIRIKVMLPLLFLPAILSVEILSNETYKKLLLILKYLIPLVFIFYIFVHVFIDGRSINTFVHFTIKEKIKVSQFYLLFILMIPVLETLKQLYYNNKVIVNSFILILSFMILLTLGNKTTLMFLLLLSVGMLIKYWKKSKKKGISVLLSIIILSSIALQIPIIKNRMAVFVKTTDLNLHTVITKNRFTITKNTFEHRVLINYLSLLEIKKAFPFGVGTGDFQDKLNEQYQRVGFKEGIRRGFNNHNQYLSEFLKTGVLGGIFFILLIFSLLKLIKKEYFFYSYIIIFFTIGCFVESYLDRQHGVIIFAFLIPFFLYNERN